MPLAPLPRLAYANALLRMITEFSGLYPFVFQYVMHANEDTWLAVGVCLQAFTRLLGVPVATRVVWHPRPSLSLPRTVLVVEVDEARVEAAALGRVAGGGHAGVPLQREGERRLAHATRLTPEERLRGHTLPTAWVW